MIRRFGFGFVVVTAFIVAACGRQVSPNPPNFGAGGAAPGYMSVKFDVAAPFNPSSYQYWVVFNTSGNGLTPGTYPFQSNWAAYSAAIEVAGSGASISARGIQFVKGANGQIPSFQPLITTPQQLQFVANSNGSGTEFTVTFQRTIFNSIATPGPSPTPFSNTWEFNAFSTQANGQNNLVYVDSMGAGGPSNPQYNSPQFDITQTFDSPLYALNSTLQIDPAATIVSVEIANNP